LNGLTGEDLEDLGHPTSILDDAKLSNDHNLVFLYRTNTKKFGVKLAFMELKANTLNIGPPP
jgi:hypothetical protein